MIRTELSTDSPPAAPAHRGPRRKSKRQRRIRLISLTNSNCVLSHGIGRGERWSRSPQRLNFGNAAWNSGNDRQIVAFPKQTDKKHRQAAELPGVASSRPRHLGPPRVGGAAAARRSQSWKRPLLDASVRPSGASATASSREVNQPWLSNARSRPSAGS